MGSFMSRQHAAVEEAEQSSNTAYKYPPRAGNFFGSHFIMGGERFDTPQPESYLFGENADLNFLGNRPTAFPYPPPQTNEPTKTLKSLVNIRKESVRFVRAPTTENRASVAVAVTTASSEEEIDGNVLCTIGADIEPPVTPTAYNIEFTFDSDAKCAITIYYFCTEEVSPSGVTLFPRDGLTSETYHFEKGINQSFSQPGHVFNPQLIPEDDLVYSSTKEQYPVAIHCLVEEGNEECRQSHTTICVIDHHPESNSYVLRALKQKIFVDGLCYLLQEIYGIENKAVNKSSIDEEIDDHGSECVICMSETRDTLILPCRHLCLCNSCADSLRYQANNCPICRAPFRALLQIRAVQKGVSTHVLHQNTPTSSGGEPTPCDVPPGYVAVSLIEALNGPPQYVSRTRNNESGAGDATDSAATSNNQSGDNNKATSPLKPNSQRRPKIKKNASTCTNTSEVGTTTTSTATATNGNGNNSSNISVVEIECDTTKTGTTTATTSTGTSSSSSSTSNTSSTSSASPSAITTALTTTGGATNSSNKSQDKLQIVNERHNLKLPKQKRMTPHEATAVNAVNADEDDDDSENEKLSPLLSPGSNCKAVPARTMKQVVASMGNNDDDDICLDTEEIDYDGGGGDSIMMTKLHRRSGSNASLKKNKRSEMSSTASISAETANPTSAGSTANMNAEDSDYYTPEDTQNSILSPLCPARSGDQLMGNISSGGGGVGIKSMSQQK